MNLRSSNLYSVYSILPTYFVNCRRTLLKLNFKGPYLSSETEIKFRLCLFTFSIKHEIRHFHVVVVQKRERNVQKSERDARAKLLFCLGPVHTYPEIFVSANLFMRIHLASTRVRRIRSMYPEISVYALQSGNFCIRCDPDTCGRSIRIFLYTLTSQYQNQSFSARDLTNPLRCPDTNRIRVDGRIRFVYTTCGRRYFCIRIKKFADTKISGYVSTGPYCLLFLWPSRCRPRRCILKSLLTANNRRAFSMTLRTLDNLVHSWLV